jgi:3-oxoacyl-[acyl-carrier-protein] synthase II
LLEEYEAAKARGATLYGEIVGTASTAAIQNGVDGQRQQALTAAARAVLASSLLKPGDIGHVNAHALGTPTGDEEEAAALVAALNSEVASTPVVAAKSFFGNLGAASGAVETIASVLALHHGQLFPTLNYATPDPKCPLNVATAAKPQAPGGSFLKLSVTPQGQAAAIVVRRA